MSKTPCPFCQQEIAVPDAPEAPCPACGKPLRFIDAPEAPCQACGANIPVVPGQDVLRCRECGGLQAADPARSLAFQTVCPRCRRHIDVPARATAHTCSHCRAEMRLEDTL